MKITKLKIVKIIKFMITVLTLILKLNNILSKPYKKEIFIMINLINWEKN